MSARPAPSSVLAALAILAALAVARPAAAQGGNRSVFVAGAAGLDASTSGTYAGGPELGGFVELAFVRQALRVRGEIGVGFGDLDEPGATVPGHVQRLRLAGSVLKTLHPFGRRRRLFVFVGGGAGVHIDRRDGGANGIVPAVHGLGGVEYALPHASGRWSVGGEAHVQRRGAPDEPGPGQWLTVVRVGGFVKCRITSAWLQR